MIFLVAGVFAFGLFVGFAVGYVKGERHGYNRGFFDGADAADSFDDPEADDADHVGPEGDTWA